MRILTGVLLVLLCQGSLLADENEVTDVRLRVGQSAANCSFDRVKSKSFRLSENTISGNFSVNCSNTSSPYRLVTSLSPLAMLHLNEDRRMSVKWLMKKDSAACDATTVHPDAIDFHSGSRELELEGQAGVTNWFYCLKLKQNRGKGITRSEIWPINGELSLSIEDHKVGEWLPKNASVIRITFTHNSHDLSVQGKNLLNSVLMNVGGPDKVNIQIHAHTSHIGEASYNHDLSLMRLKNVREWLLVEGGMNKRHMWGQAWGEERPFAIKTPDDEGSQNRRVDVIFLPKDHSSVVSVDTAPAPKLMME